MDNRTVANLVSPYSFHDYDGHKLTSLLKRRRSILTETRKIISESGLEELKLSHVAERCGTTTQTIYNNFGPKNDLACTALTDYCDIVHDVSQSLSSDIDFFLNYHRAYFLACCHYPSFMRELIFSSMSKKNAMVFKLSSHGKVFKVKILEDLEAHGCLRKFVDKRRFIDHFSRSTTFNLFAWAYHDDYSDLLQKLMSETISLLSDILNERAMADSRRWLADNLPTLREGLTDPSLSLGEQS